MSGHLSCDISPSTKLTACGETHAAFPSGDASRLNRAALRRSLLRFGRNTPGPVLPVGAPPSRALSAGPPPHRLLTACGETLSGGIESNRGTS